MTERPIIFSGPMVRAILDGRKYQTRRLVKKQPPEGITEALNPDADNPRWFGFWGCEGFDAYQPHNCLDHEAVSPYATGDRLWVRETFGVWHRGDATPYGNPYDPVVEYRADGEDPLIPDEPLWEPFKWRPSIHMPKWAARIWLEVTGVRVERLHDISEEDAIAEGCRPYFDHENPEFVTCPNGSQTPMAPLMGPLDDFKRLWDSINAKRAPWSSNPWVWIIEFRRVND